MKVNTYNLTNPQKSILYTEQYFKNTAVNNIGGTVLIKEKVDFDKLIQAIHIFLKDNDAFHIRVTMNSKQEFVQYFSEEYELDSHILSLKDEQELSMIENQMVQIPFSFMDSQLFRFQLFKFSDFSGGFILNTHHLIVDACTASLVANKVITIYSALLKDEVPNVEPTSYLNYLHSEQEYIESSRFQKDKEYWESVFDKAYEIATIPSSGKTGLVSCEAIRKTFILSGDKVKSINDFCSKNKISIFNFFMALYAIYLHKVTDLSEFVIGTPILNRSTFVEKNTPGMFISTMPFQFSVTRDSTFVNFAKDIASNSLSMFRHQKYPYQNILEYIRSKNPSQPNLYDILISYQNTKTNRNSSDIPYEVRWTFSHHTSDSLDIHIFDMNDTGSLNISYDYQTAKYSDEDITSLHLRILNIIDSVLEAENLLISDIKVVTPEEENYVLNVLNHSSYEYDKSLTLIDLFEEQVQKTPHQTAICFSNTSYTYLQLQQLVDTIATQIADKGLFLKNISVIANKSIKTVASFLAIMKSGNCYIPIDPSYPQDRIDYILENSCSDMTICDRKYASLAKNYLILDDIEIDSNATFHSLASPNMLAYMIYTSGSTGKPKGVKIKHCNIINTLIWRKNYYCFDSSIHVLQIPSFSFDSSVEDIYTPLISGSKLVIPDFEKIDPNQICNLIHLHDINHFLIVPSLYRILLSEKSDSLVNFKFITIAGESFNENLVNEHFEKLPNVRLVNEYGPTENSVCSTFYEFSKENHHIYIGTPINNCQCFVLNSQLELLPPNTTGELYLSGVGVSDGYLNRDDLTSERFLTNSPFAPRLYKTGDLVKYNLHSGLEFVGRNDSQIKLNGFRIELQEICSIILKYNLVKDVVCLLKNLPNMNKDILVAYVTTLEGFEVEYLNALLRKSLPYYMVPRIVVLDAFPTTPNGKVDKKALPLPNEESKHVHRNPKNALEKKILDICLDIIPNKALHVDDDLFTVGLADSLMILTISSRLFAEDIKIPTQYFYQYPTIEKLVANRNQIFKEILSHTDVPNLKYTTDVTRFDFSTLQFPYKNILLTGATGFLGIHILYYLLTTTNAHISCLIRRKSGLSPNERLEKLFYYYFGDEYFSLLHDRVTVLEGELTESHFNLSNEDYSSLKSSDCVIHAAAITKHYGDFEIFYHSNILSTQNIVDFCKENHIILNHMSTTSISGFINDENTSKVLTENDFYIGQNYKSNVYINSKFLAEAIIYKEQYNGLKANVFRLGNLMGRYSDGMFQINKHQNAFYTKLLALAKLKLVPDNLTDFCLDFSPIDTVSRSILALLSIPNLQNCIFHITNPNVLCISELIEIFSSFGLTLKLTNPEHFVKTLSENANLMKYFVSDLSEQRLFDLSSNILIANDITNDFLVKTNFEWPKIDKDYLLRFLTKTDFFNDILK